jgi:type IV pilus assembly protein PilA
MSDAPQGPGWWQASDGRWYPPTSAPAPGRTAWADDVLPAGPPLGAPQQTAGKATATLVLAILSFFTCPVFSIAALIVAARADAEIRDSYGRLGGEGMVKAGRVVAIVNLAYSVLLVPILLAIAIPTFLGAKERAQDRATQSELRNAYAAEKVIATDQRSWTADPAALAAIEPSLQYQSGTRPLAKDVVYVAVAGEVLELSARADSGTCFYLVATTSGDLGYAEDEGCGDASVQDFTASWR